MTLQQETIARSVASGPNPAIDHDSNAWSTSPLVERLAARMDGSGPRYAARAPVPVDVMGGIAECSGGLMLRALLGEVVVVIVQPRNDGRITVEWAERDGIDGAPIRAIPVRELCVDAHQPLPATDARHRFAGHYAPLKLSLLGGVIECWRSGMLGPMEGGWSVRAAASNPNLSTSSLLVPAMVATISALSHRSDQNRDARGIAEMALTIQQEWLGWTQGLADGMATLTGESRTLQLLRSDTRAPQSPIALPEQWVIAAVDCAAEAADAPVTNIRVRTAAAMGRFLIERIVRHESGDGHHWGGSLSGVSVSDYVDRFRDRLPTKMKGQEFLLRFGQGGDEWRDVEPAFIYKVRSRTEHMIYEHARAIEFAETTARGGRKTDPSIITAAGELMYASHWSYGQRCGLGSIETDLMVNLLRAQGVEHDIYGAKVCGHGCGGLVAVLARTTPRADAALAEACALYHRKTGKSAHLLRGSLPGITPSGMREL